MPDERTLPDSTTVAEGPTSPSIWRRVAGWPVVLVLGVLVLVTRLPGLVSDHTFNTDEATLGVGGRVLRSGGSLYVDLIDRKPPLPFAAYAVFGTEHLQLIRFVVAVLVLGAAWLCADEAKRRWGSSAGWVAGLIVVLGAAALAPADAQAANFELFALFPIVVAVVAAARGRSALAGVALAVAVLCKQPAAVTILPVGWSWWATRRWRGVGTGLAAGAVTGVVLAAPFGLANVIEWALLGTGGYLAFDPADLGFLAVRLLAVVAIAAGFWAGAWLLLIGGRTGGADEPSTGAGGVDLDLWLLFWGSLVGVVAGFRFFPHYVLQVLPAVALLAARGYSRRPALQRPAVILGVAATVITAGLAWSVVVSSPPKEQTDMAAYARANTAPDDTILVWGNEPEVYWRAHRRPAGGFTHSEFVTGYSGGRRPRPSTEANVPDADVYQDWIDRLRADPPELIFDTSAADLRGGRWFPLAGFGQLQGLIHARYERVATIDEVPVYRLRSGTTS